MKLTHLLYIILTILIFTSCRREDDIDEIFYGKTWYMTGIVINGITSPQDTRNFYQTDNTYHITFSAGTFKGTLSSGVNISGTWTADGKHQTIHLAPDAQSNLSQFDLQLYHILEEVTSYSSGAEFLHLADGNGNKVLFSISRSKVYN